jgi:hypothetical protein
MGMGEAGVVGGPVRSTTGNSNNGTDMLVGCVVTPPRIDSLRLITVILTGPGRSHILVPVPYSLLLVLR